MEERNSVNVQEKKNNKNHDNNELQQDSNNVDEEQRTSLLHLQQQQQPSIIATKPPSSNQNHYQYGLGNWTPPGLQFLANKRAFLVLFCATCVLQGTFHTYFVAVITTLEKLWGIPSRTIGTLMMASEVGQVSSSLLLPYFASGGHRPRWIGLGSGLFSIATLLCASPHFLLPLPPDAILIQQQLPNATATSHINFCTTSSFHSNDSNCYGDQEQLEISMETGQGPEWESRKYLVFGVIFMSLLSIGLGQTAIFTLGIPYLDDNVGGRDSPVYFSITIGVRILGPVLGFVLGSLCTRLWIHPLDPPPPDLLTPSDPRWLGAWWVGMLLISGCLFTLSFFMCAFPRELRRKEKKKLVIAVANGDASENTKLPAAAEQPSRTLRNFPAAMRRLLSNRILLLRTFSSVFHLLPISGLYTFLPKYLESEFKMAAFEANMVTGLGGILTMGVGIFASGVYFRKFEPAARNVAIWVATSAGIYAGGMMLLGYVGCGGGISEPAIITMGGVGTPACPNPICNSCPDNAYSPICGSDGNTYLSPCHAGCLGFVESAEGVKYTNCSCIATPPSSPGTATPSPCTPPGCPHFPLYLFIFITIVLVHSSSEVGSMLLTLRSVEPRDKAMALGLIQTAIGLLGNVPCPVVYGAVVDQACVVWAIKGGSGGGSGGSGGSGGGCHGDLEEEPAHGHCWVYDGAAFRFYFHGLTSLLMTTAFLIDVAVVLNSKKISLNDDEKNNALNNSPIELDSITTINPVANEED